LKRYDTGAGFGLQHKRAGAVFCAGAQAPFQCYIPLLLQKKENISTGFEKININRICNLITNYHISSNAIETLELINFREHFVVQDQSFLAISAIVRSFWRFPEHFALSVVRIYSVKE